MFQRIAVIGLKKKSLVTKPPVNNYGMNKKNIERVREKGINLEFLVKLNDGAMIFAICKVVM